MLCNSQQISQNWLGWPGTQIDLNDDSSWNSTVCQVTESANKILGADTTSSWNWLQ